MGTASPPTSENPIPERDRRAALRPYVGVVLILYWITLFLATHVPVPKLPTAAPGADKVVHLLGYGVLGILIALWTALGTPLTIPRALSLWGILAIYGALDEWLQQFVNRTTDAGDWIADVIGSAIGIGVIWLLQRIRPLDDPRVTEESS